MRQEARRGKHVSLANNKTKRIWYPHLKKIRAVEKGTGAVKHRRSAPVACVPESSRKQPDALNAKGEAEARIPDDIQDGLQEPLAVPVTPGRDSSAP